ncbi:MAG: FixH family protein [Pseudobdellovibrionaceae bacterium]
MSSDTLHPDTPKPPVDPQEKRSARIVLYSLIGFFIVFCTVDIFFVYKAVTTNTGVVTEQSYEAGLSYDQYAEEAREQATFETHSVLEFANGQVSLHLKDVNNEPIAGAKVTAQAMHAMNESDDIADLSLAETAPGIYEAPLTLTLAGSWTLKVTAKWVEGKEEHLFQKQLSVAQP